MPEETSAVTPLKVLNLVHEMFALSHEERHLLLRLIDAPVAVLTPTVTIAAIEGMRHRYAREGMHLLSPREKVVLSLIMGGKNGKEIARILNISPNTVQAHRRRAKDKLGAENTADLVRLASNAGLEARF